MRITGGKLGGRHLVAPDDSRVRPTSDRTRQAIFNMLRHKDFGTGFTLDGAAVLDLFAGTGALGIEAISQGARWCLMVDDNADSRALQRENVEALGLTGATRIWRRDATDLGPIGPSANGPFDLVFLDPPYRKDLIAPALASLKAGGWLNRNALIVVETDASEDFEAPGYTLIDERDYGETRVRFFALSPMGSQGDVTLK
jgi:16S rRNA (guanine966-N2)-methyltransferase